ncbi:DUF1877 family protein [Streptomyces sp. NRAIS4]
MAVTQPALSAAQVAHISELLAQIDFPALLATLPTNDTQAVSLIGNGADQIVGGPRTYLLQHFNALGEFYRRAAQRHLLLVLWWDRHRARPPRLLTQHPKNYVNFCLELCARSRMRVRRRRKEAPKW